MNFNDFLNEKRNVTLKRKYTENHPAVKAGLTARVRNKMIEAVADGKLSQEEFKTILSEFSTDSARWIRRNSKYFNVSEDGISLSKFGRRLFKTVIITENQGVILESTRSHVGIIDKRGKITSTYIHYDGYPEGVGATVLNHFADTKKVKELLKLGRYGISYLEQGIEGGEGHSFNTPIDGQTVFYGRDRGQVGSRYDSTFKADQRDLQDYLSDVSNDAMAEYVYLWDEAAKQWMYAEVGTRDGRMQGLKVLENVEAIGDYLFEGKYEDMLDEGEGHVHFIVKDEAAAEKFADAIEEDNLGDCDFYTEDGKVYLRASLSVGYSGKEVANLKKIEKLVGMKAKAGSPEVWAADESVDEGRNAFITAARAAKAEGLKEFEFQGKTFPVTVKDVSEEEAEETEEAPVEEAITEKFTFSKGNTRDAKKVAKKLEQIMMSASALTADEVTHFGAVRYLMESALEDANFHRYIEPVGKALGGRIKTINIKINNLGDTEVPVGAKAIRKFLDTHYSALSQAAGWSGIGIVEGVASYIYGWGYHKEAQKIVDVFNNIYMNESSKKNIVSESFSDFVSGLNETRFYAIFQGSKHEIEAKDMFSAKKQAIADLKIKKKDQGLLSIVNADQHDDFSKGKNMDFAFEGELLAEAFKSAKLQQLFNTKVSSNWSSRSMKQLPKAFYGMTQIALDKVEDEDLIDMENPREAHSLDKKGKGRYVTFYIVDQDKRNHHAPAEGYTTIPAGIIAIVRNNNFQGVTWASTYGRNNAGYKGQRLSSTTDGGVGISKKYKGWDGTGLYNPKRIADVADRAVMIDILAVQDKYSTKGKRADREAARKGATAFKSDKDFKQENIKRYKQILADKAAKLPLDKMVNDAIEMLTTQIKHGLESGETNNNEPILGYDPKGRPVRMRDASNHMSQILDDYADYVRYSNDAKDEIGNYYAERIKIEAKSIKDRINKIATMNYVW